MLLEGPKIGVVLSERGQAIDLPSEAICIEKNRIEEMKRNIRGLVAVGVPVREAVGSYSVELKMTDAVGLFDELCPTGIACMHELYEHQKDIDDKAAFGKACMENGFSPVGVALCAMRYSYSDIYQDGAEEAKALVLAFGVDTFMAGWIGGWLDIGPTVVCDVTAPKLIVPCAVAFRGFHLFEGPMVVPWLTEVGSGGISTGAFDSISNVAFPNLRRVEGNLGLEKSHNVYMPTLALVGGRLHARSANDLCLPMLNTVGEKCNFDDTSNLSMPLLESIGGDLFIEQTEELSLPALRYVAGEVRAKGLKDQVIPSLLEIGGSAWLDGSENLSMPSLTKIGKLICRQGAVGLDLPRLGSVNGQAYLGRPQ